MEGEGFSFRPGLQYCYGNGRWEAYFEPLHVWKTCCARSQMMQMPWEFVSVCDRKIVVYECVCVCVRARAHTHTHTHTHTHERERRTIKTKRGRKGGRKKKKKKKKTVSSQRGSIF